MSNKTPKVSKKEIESAHSPALFTRKKTKLVLLAGVLAGLMIFVWSAPPSYLIEDETCTLVSHETGQGDVCIRFEHVSSPAELRQGLSGREALATDAGMLFDFGGEAEYCMWMKDMNFPIDIIWLDNKGTVVSVFSDVSPESYPDIFCNEEAPARYVLEVNAGIAQKANIQPGQVIEL